MVQNEKKYSLASPNFQIPNLDKFNSVQPYNKLPLSPGHLKINFEQKKSLKSSSNTSSLIITGCNKNNYDDSLFEAYKTVLK